VFDGVGRWTFFCRQNRGTRGPVNVVTGPRSHVYCPQQTMIKLCGGRPNPLKTMCPAVLEKIPPVDDCRRLARVITAKITPRMHQHRHHIRIRDVHRILSVSQPGAFHAKAFVPGAPRFLEMMLRAKNLQPDRA